MLLLGQFYYVEDANDSQIVPRFALGIHVRSCSYIIFLTAMISGLFNLYNVLLTVNIVMILRRREELFNRAFCKIEVVSLFVVLAISIILIKYRDKDLSNGDCAFHEIKKVAYMISILASLLFMLVMFSIIYLVWKVN